MKISIVLLVLVVILLVVMYNSLVRLNIRTSEAWSDILVQLKRRADLIPNLVNTVKGYAKHEKTIFEEVTKARAASLSASTPDQAAKAEGDFQKTMKSLFAVAENYPTLKASDNFKELQDELTDTEDKIQASRRFYNSMVRDFNTKRKTFPTNLLASTLGFKEDKQFFMVDNEDEIKDPVEVKF
ncbi:LemA family protein [bacterium]|jgi:LemA protein|nr:LemA family protein [bacterium]